MSGLEEVRRALRERERFAPDPAGVLAAARARGRRLRRVRRAYTMVGAAAATAALLAATAVITRPGTAGGVGHPTARPAVSVLWSTGSPYETGPITAAPLRSRHITGTIPYTVRLPAGWRELSFAAQYGQFQARYVRAGFGGPLLVTMDIVPVAANRRPTGDPRTGTPDEHGVLSWQAGIHYVRLSTSGPVDRELYRMVAATLDFGRVRPLRMPIAVGSLPPGSYLYAASVTLPPGITGYHPPEGWGAGLWVMMASRSGTVLEPASFQVAFGPGYTDQAGRQAITDRLASRAGGVDPADPARRLGLVLRVAHTPSDPGTWPAVVG